VAVSSACCRSQPSLNKQFEFVVQTEARIGVRNRKIGSRQKVHAKRLCAMDFFQHLCLLRFLIAKYSDVLYFASISSSGFHH
jgi:hypothetical protein